MADETIETIEKRRRKKKKEDLNYKSKMQIQYSMKYKLGAKKGIKTDQPTDT